MIVGRCVFKSGYYDYVLLKSGLSQEQLSWMLSAMYIMLVVGCLINVYKKELLNFTTQYIPVLTWFKVTNQSEPVIWVTDQSERVIRVT